MEKGFNSWSQDREIEWQSLNMNLSSAPFGLGSRVIFPSFGNMVSPHVCHEPYGWFYGTPRHRPGFVPMGNSIVKEVEKKLPEASPYVACETNAVKKKFLVFDQSGDQTTMMYSLGGGPSSTRYQFPSLNRKPQFGSPAVCGGKLIRENDGNDSESEMQEDTEELNALLYSDDDEDDDETSTGHSPGSMTGFREEKRKIDKDEEEEVASSEGPLKRRKKDDVSSLVHTFEDAASSGINCSGNAVFKEEYDNFSSGNKKLRKEKMKETINVLQNLIPGDSNGKSAIMVIDEAIHYLRSLKVKALALGLDSF